MANTSSVTICNAAILRLNGNMIASFNDGTKESIACSAIYDFCRQSLLRAHPWNFATQLQELAQLTNTPTFQWGYAYQLPYNCLRVLRLYQGTPWEIVGQTLYSNDTGINLYFIYDCTDTTQFDTVFSELLALKIALAITGSINADLSLIPILRQEYEEKFKEAKQYNAQEDTPLQWNEGDWVAEHNRV